VFGMKARSSLGRGAIFPAAAARKIRRPTTLQTSLRSYLEWQHARRRDIVAIAAPRERRA